MTKISHQNKLLCLLVLALLSTTVFLNSLGNGFALDDLIHIKDNPHLTSARPIWYYFFEPIFPWNLYRPLVQASYQVTYNLYGLNPLPYHLINVLTHAVITVLVFSLITRILGFRPGLMTALLFAVMPIHTEAVANVSGRYELWSALGVLTTLIICSKGEWKALDYLTSGFTFSLAIFSKESAVVTIPLVILVLWYQSNCSRQIVSQRLLALVVSLNIYLILRLQALKDYFISSATTVYPDNPLINEDLLTRVFNGAALLGRYFTLSVVGTPLSADYSFAELLVQKPFSDLATTATVAVVILLLLIALYQAKRREPSGFALLWFFLAFSITANIFFPIGTIFAERLAYLPSLGVCMLLASLLNASARCFRITLLLLLVLYYGFLTIERNKVWRDNSTLFSAQIEISPNSTKTQFNYAMVLRLEKELDRAEEHLGRALKIYPKNLDALWGLGIVASDRGDHNSAEKHLLSVLDHNPYHSRTLNSLSRLYLRQNRLSEAEKFVNRLMKSWGGQFESKLTYFAYLIAKEEKIEANKLLLHLNSINPNHSELTSLVEQGQSRGIF